MYSRRALSEAAIFARSAIVPRVIALAVAVVGAAGASISPEELGNSINLGVKATGSLPSGVGLFSGRCSKLVVQDQDRTTDCSGELARVVLGTGVVMFIFSARSIFPDEKELIAFHGNSAAILQKENGVALLQTPHISVGYQGRSSPTVVDATGSCIFREQPSSIECSATSKGREFAGVFVSDGTAPR
jgi:hypothetical protein